jgi:hypothetical protein
MPDRNHRAAVTHLKHLHALVKITQPVTPWLVRLSQTCDLVISCNADINRILQRLGGPVCLIGRGGESVDSFQHCIFSFWYRLSRFTSPFP